MINYIYGAGGHGKVVLDALHKSGHTCIGFIDDKPLQEWARLPVISPASMPADAGLHLAIGNSAIREKLVRALVNHTFFNVTHPTVTVAATARLADGGSFFAANAIIGPDASVGRHTIVNHAAIIDHDCVVADFCHIAPNATLGGGVSIGKHVLIGAGAVILPGVQIADHVTIGAGAVVTKNIVNAGTYVGVPAKSLG